MERQSADSADAPNPPVYFPFLHIVISGDISSRFVLISLCVLFWREGELPAVPPRSGLPFHLVELFLGRDTWVKPHDELLPAEWQKSRTSLTGPGGWEGRAFPAPPRQ